MAKEEIKYYLDDNGGLWKMNGSEHLFFSRKTFEWVKAEIFFILPCWEQLPCEQVEQKLEYLKSLGKDEWERTPIRYFSNDNDDVFAIDLYGNEYYVLADMSLKPANKGTVDCMWDGLSKEEAESFVEKEYKEEKWVLAGSGSKLTRYIGDYEGIIWLGDYQGGLPKSKIGYRSEVIHDDGMSDPAIVAFFESDSIDELKKMTEFRMNRGSVIIE